jgi:prephenate dehydrogenase
MIAVVGLGLIGGSLALRLVEQGHDVSACDPDADTRAAAADAGIDVHEAPGPWLGGADLVVVATPLDAMPSVLRTVARFGEGTVFDVGSVKTAAHRAAEAAGLADRFVGAHPMAGTEHSGFAAASASLLTGATWAVTFTPDTDQDRLLGVVRFLCREMPARVTVLEPSVHDRSVAVVSHGPHVAASMLLAALGADGHPAVSAALAAGSFRDGTRVAGTNTARTANMILENRAAMADYLHRLSDDLAELLDVIEDDSAVVAWFDKARVARDSWLRPRDDGPVERVRTVAELAKRCADGWVVVGETAEDLLLQRGVLNVAFQREG